MKFKKLFVVLGILMLPLCLGTVLQAGDQPQWPETVDAKVAAAMKTVKMIDMEQFKGIVDGARGDLIIDVREANEYAEGHVPGAINIPRGVIEFKIWKEVGYPEHTDTARSIYLYCKTGGRTALATQSLAELGFTNLTGVKMKMAEWEKSGYPTTK